MWGVKEQKISCTSRSRELSEINDRSRRQWPAMMINRSRVGYFNTIITLLIKMVQRLINYISQWRQSVCPVLQFKSTTPTPSPRTVLIQNVKNEEDFQKFYSLVSVLKMAIWVDMWDQEVKLLSNIFIAHVRLWFHGTQNFSLKKNCYCYSAVSLFFDILRYYGKDSTYFYHNQILFILMFSFFIFFNLEVSLKYNIIYI